MNVELDKITADKIKWRRHELSLITASALIILAGYLWGISKNSSDGYEAPFINNHVSFSLFKNVMLPDLSLGIIIYLAYLWINLYTIPRLLFPKKFEAGTGMISI
jgi:hypothetical protein